MNRPFPIQPSFGAADPLRAWRRKTTVEIIAKLTDRDVVQIAERLYGDDAETVLKAAVAPADTSTTAWAGALTGTIVGPFLKSMRGRSAAARLIELSRPLNISRGAITLPKLSADFPSAAWVAEGGPAPVFKGAFASTTIAPRKLVALSALTNELAERSAEDAERIIIELLTDSGGRALDAKMFSADAATGTAPAGLFNGISATAGTAGGGVTAMATDLKALTAAVATAGGGGNLAIVAAAAQAMSLQLLAPGLEVPVLTGPSIASGTVAVLDVNAFASGFGGDPQVDVADNAVIHMDDASPAAIGTAGSPNVVAAPTLSAFQADMKVLRCILRVGYALRAPALAYTTTATW